MNTVAKKGITKRELIGIIAAIVVIAASYLIQPTELLTRSGITTIALLISFLVILITEALPMVVACFIFLGLMPLLGATANFSQALSGFSNQVVMFIVASFGIANAFTNIPLSKRILLGLIRKFGKNVKSMLFAMMAAAAIISAVVSNVPTCAIFMAISLSFLELYDNPEDKKRTGRAFMIGVPVASMIGGMMTPAGSSINLLAISLLEQHAGLTISFAQWMLAGIPLTIVLLPIAWLLIVKIYKPAEIDSATLRAFGDTLGVPEKVSTPEKKVIVITLIMLVLWIASSWVKSINVMVVALLGCAVMFVPGIRVLEINSFLRENSWDSFFLMGTVLSMGGAMVTNGVSAWIVSILPTMNVSAPILVGFCALLTFVLLIIIPVAPSLVTIMATPFLALAAGAGVSSQMILLCLALVAGNCYLLPLDTVTLLTYGTGYYSMTDMAKSTSIIQIIIVVLMAVWLPLVGKMCGFM